MARVPTLVSQGQFLQGQSQMQGIHHKGDPQTLPPMLEIIRTRELLEASGSQTSSTVTSVNGLGTLPMNAPLRAPLSSLMTPKMTATCWISSYQMMTTKILRTASLSYGSLQCTKRRKRRPE